MSIIILSGLELFCANGVAPNTAMELTEQPSVESSQVDVRGKKSTMRTRIGLASRNSPSVYSAAAHCQSLGGFRRRDRGEIELCKGRKQPEGSSKTRLRS